MFGMRTPTIVATMVVALALSACDEGPAPDASGEEVYAQVCAGCHGDDLGGGLGPPLGPGSDAAEHPDELYRQAITDGRGRMPSFSQTLSEDQIERVIEFLRVRQAST